MRSRKHTRLLPTKKLFAAATSLLFIGQSFAFEQVNITLVDASESVKKPLAPQTVYIRKVNENGRTSYWGASKLDQSGVLQLDLPNLTSTDYILQVVSPNTGKRVVTDIIEDEGDYTFDVGAYGLKVSLINAVTEQTIADTRVRLYWQNEQGYWKWQSDSKTDADGKTAFDLPKLANEGKYKLNSLVFNNTSQNSELIEQPGKYTFAMGPSLLTFIDGPSGKPLANQNVNFRKVVGSSSKFYKNINTDENGQIQLQLPELAQGYYATTATLDEPTKGLTHLINQPGKMAIYYGEEPVPEDMLKVTLSNAITETIIPNTRIRVYQFDESQQRFIWHKDTLTDEHGKVDIILPGLLDNNKYVLNTTVFNDIASQSSELSEAGKIDFKVGDTQITLIDEITDLPIADQRVTIRKKSGSTSTFYNYVQSDEYGVIQLDLPGLAEQEEQYYISVDIPSLSDISATQLIEKAGIHRLVLSEPADDGSTVDDGASDDGATNDGNDDGETGDGETNNDDGTSDDGDTLHDGNEVFNNVYPAVKSPNSAVTLSEFSLSQQWATEVENDVISSGVPFAFGELHSIDNVKVMLGEQKVTAQFDQIASWPDGSIKSLLVTLQPVVGIKHDYRLVYGTEVENQQSSQGVKVQDSPSSLSLDTGKVKLVLAKTGSPFDQLFFDSNSNGQYEQQELQLTQGDIFLTSASDGDTYTASNGTTSIAVEQSGPLKTVVKLTGKLFNDSSNALTDYIVRITALKGASQLSWEYTLIDTRHTNVYDKSPELTLSVSQYGIKWNQHTGASNVLTSVDGQQAEALLDEERYIHQAGEFNYDNGSFLGHEFSANGMSNGEKVDGWFSLQSPSSQLTLFAKDFWQNFPGEISATSENLVLSLHPDRFIGQPDVTYPAHEGTKYKRPNTFYFYRAGGAKTSRFNLVFNDSIQEHSQLTKVNNTYQKVGINLLADQQRYLSTGVYGQLTKADQSESIGYDGWLKRSVLNYSWRDGKAAKQFGWRDYGDRLRAGWAGVTDGVRIPSFYNDTHIGANGFFKQYLRTGDVTWFEVAEQATRHFMDIDVNHGTRSGYWRTNGVQPAGELLAGNHDAIDHYARNLHTGHAHISGLTDYYLLTGDKRSREVIEEIGQWWKFFMAHAFQLPFDKDKYREAERDFGWPLYVMNEYVRVSNDTEYHRRVAGQMVHYVTQWFNTPLAHKVRGEVVGINDASQGTGYWTMTKMDNHGMTDSNGTNPWMAGALMSALIQFHEYDKMVGSSIEHDQMMEMLMQTLNYIVKFGYNHENNHFGYSEIIQSYGGGGFQLLYAMVYIGQEYDARLSAGKITNPQWYDTQPLWAPIQQRIIDKVNGSIPGANSQSYGFYGYEIPWPLDIWSLISP